jgi:serine phosphatase RsbU (regulator of sigma subunit)
VLSSLAPLWQAVHTLPNEVLSDGARASESLRHRSLSQSLVIAEIAVAFTLLAVSAVLIAQLENLTRVRPGFDPNGLVTFQLDVGEGQYGTAAKVRPYQTRLIQALESIPAVQSATFINHVPLAGCCFSTAIYPEGRTIDPNAVQGISYNIAGTGYLRTMRIPLLKGRFLNEQDTGENPVHVAINQAAARYYWPNRDALGAYGRMGGTGGDRFQVIGVVGDVRNDELGRPTVPEIYFSNALLALHRMHFLVRSAVPEKILTVEIRRAVQRVDPAQPIHDFETMNDIVTGSLSLQRVSSFMTGFFAVAALLLATLGVYGVMAYSVRQRTVEIGTRMALGATRRDVFRLVIGGGMKMAVYGVVIGGVAVVAAVWLLMRAFGIHDLDPRSFVYSTALVAGVASFASWVPAWRATLLSPMVAIRNEPGSLWQSALSHLVSRGGEDVEVSEGTLGSEFIEAVRRAESFSAALHSTLETLCEKIGSESAFLLERAGDKYRCVSAVPEQGIIACALLANGFLLRRFRFYHRPLPLTEGDFETWLRWAAEHQPQYVAEIETLMKIRARLAVPLRTGKEIPGMLLLGPPVARKEYNAAQKRALRSWAERFGLLMENARLTDRVVEQEKLRRDLALAVEVQRRLLPDKPPGSAAMTIAAVSVPARSVGGDYYDFLEVDGRQIGIALADIAGKGVAAALIMSVVQASLRIISAEGNVSLPELAAKMNRFLYRSTRSNSYATFFYAQVDEPGRQLRYVNAGHNPPYLLRFADNPEAEIEELSTGGTIIGMFPHVNYEEAAVDLRSGDVLVVFPDGVTEALNPREEEFGEERLKDLLRRVAHLSVNEMCAQISQELRNWIEEAAQYDDLTFIVMKVN